MKASILLVVLLAITGCGEYIESKVYEIETVNGERIKLLCPTIDPYRSKWTYVISGHCALVER